jgi:hypothetical protein
MTMTVECPRCGHSRALDSAAIRRGTWRSPCPLCAGSSGGIPEPQGGTPEAREPPGGYLDIRATRVIQRKDTDQ